uniref:Endonuclease III homolog n=1 Tax=Culicoides sonorensis TaxID=179676 RepID=A0A336MN70_CULSO
MEKSKNSRQKVIADSANQVCFSPRKTRNAVRTRKAVKIEYEENQVKSEPKPPTKAQSKKRTSNETSNSTATEDKTVDVKVQKWEPVNFKQTLKNIQEMRKEHPAPVDTMGCDMFQDESQEPKVCRFHCLVSLMLSSQTKDEVNFAAMERLKNRFKSFSPKDVVECSEIEFEELLKPVSFYKTKAKHIKQASQVLLEQYDGDIPDSIEGLLKLPGVGKKMAHLCMKSAWNVTSGIGVDVHMHRIINRLNWVPKPTKSPEDTRVALEGWLPFEMWDEINHMLVGFGQTICAAKPKCDICKNMSICPYYPIHLNELKSKKKNEK